VESGCEVLEPLYCDYRQGYVVSPVSFICDQALCVVSTHPSTWGRIKASYD